VETEGNGNRRRKDGRWKREIRNPLRGCKIGRVEGEQTASKVKTLKEQVRREGRETEAKEGGEWNMGGIMATVLDGELQKWHHHAFAVTEAKAASRRNDCRKFGRGYMLQKTFGRWEVGRVWRGTPEAGVRKG